MKHPKSNLCVDYIIEYSKAKSRAEEEKICKRYEDIIFSHFENPDKLSEKEKRADLNLCVAMTIFGYHPIFLGDYALQLCESNGDTLKNECYITLATLENLGVVFDSTVQLYVWADFLAHPEQEAALNYLAQTKANWAPAVASAESAVLRDVLRQLAEVMFSPSTQTRSKLLALKALINFCQVLDARVSMEVLVDIQGKCTDDDILFSCCGQIPGLIEFVCDLIKRCTAIGEGPRAGDTALDPEDLRPLWNCGGCGGAASMSMATALCLDVTVHDFLALQTADIGDFLLMSAKIVKFFSQLQSINNFYKSDESILVFDEFTPDDLKRLVQSENITYSAIQKIYGMFTVDRKNVAGTWARVQLTRGQAAAESGTPVASYGPDYTMRAHYAFAGLVVAATNYQCNAFNNYAYSKSMGDIDSDLGLPAADEGAVFNMDFASKADMLWITDLSCLDSALMWLFALINNPDVNIRACGLQALTEVMQKYDIVSMLRFISAMIEKEFPDPKWKLCLTRLISMREKILTHLYTIMEYLMNLLERDKITDIDSIRTVLDFLLLYGGLITAERANRQSPIGAPDFVYIDTRLQGVLLAKAGESPESAAERGVASSSLEEEIHYYSIRRHEYVRALALLSQKLYVLSIAAMQRAAPRETLALFQVMNFEGTDRMTFSDVSSRHTFSMRQSISSTFNADTVAAITLQTLWALPKPSTALSALDIGEEEGETDVSAHRDGIRRLLDLWHVSSSHKHLLGSVNSLSTNVLKYWESMDHEFAEALSLDCGNEEPVEKGGPEPPRTPTAAAAGAKPSPDPEAAKPASLLLSPGSFSFSTISNLLNRYHVTVTAAEYLSIKCDADGAMIFGQAAGVLSVASKVNDTAATKLNCNIRDSIIFPGTVARDFFTTVSVSSLNINEKYIRSTEANGLFFLTSQPGSFPEAQALEYVCNLAVTRPRPPLQLLSNCSAHIVVKDGDHMPLAMVSGGEIGVAMTYIFTFTNSCEDRDITDMIADIPLPSCRNVVSCTTDSVTKGRIISKYDTGKRVLFTRIPKLKKGSELVLKATIELDGVNIGMLQNNTSVPTDKSRGFYLSAAPALLGFSLSNSLDDKMADYHFSNVKFELPTKSSSGAQPGNLTRSLTSSTFIKSYSCLTCDVFVSTVSMADSISRAGSGISEGSHDDLSVERAAIEELLRKANEKPGTLRLNEDGDVVVDEFDTGRITVVTKDTLCDGISASGLPPPPKPTLK